MNSCRKFSVEGRVQGVWFRETTRRQAEPLGITGHAVNRSDGSVEVLACGEPAAVEKLAAWLHQGPPLARVSSVKELDYEGECPARFRTA